MVDVVIRPPTLGDAMALLANMRPSDRAECRASHGNVFDCVSASICQSTKCWSGFVNGELAAIFGVTPFEESDAGAPWMLGTPVLDQHWRVLVRKAPGYIAEMRDAFPHLMNFVHAENSTSVGWLRRIGFTIHPAVPYGVNGELFHPFEMLP